MRRLAASLLSLVLLIAAPLPVAAQEAPIEDTIRSQIDAFLKDDFPTAFAFASPNIQSMFGTAENFGRMVVTGYPMVHRPEAVEMGELRDMGGRLWQRVEITDGAGRVHVLDYQMIETAEGWKINGVEVLRSVDAGV